VETFLQRFQQETAWPHPDTVRDRFVTPSMANKRLINIHIEAYVLIGKLVLGEHIERFIMN
jgi:hypothetical protein